MISIISEKKIETKTEAETEERIIKSVKRKIITETKKNKIEIETKKSKTETESVERKEIKMNKSNVIIQKMKLMFVILCCICMIGISLSLIIKHYSFSEYEYVWFCSKILTVKTMVNKGFNSDLVFSHISNGENIYLTNHYADYLGRIEKDGGCQKSYKKCGILDTYGNSFCIPTNDVCPVNKIRYDYSLKDSKYQRNNYEYYETDDSFVHLFYKREVLDCGIIATWIKEGSQPKYINKKNFILDKKAFKEFFKLKDVNFDDDDDDNQRYFIDIFGKEFTYNAYEYINSLQNNVYDLDRIKKLIEYIVDKINNDENNIDHNYTYVHNKRYVKNYIGFENLESMKNYNEIDFNAYKKRYPNFIIVVISFLIICSFAVFILALIIYFLKIETIEFHLAFIVIFVILYASYFLYLFIYSIFILARDFRNENFKIAKKIRADKFIEDFLKEFYTPFDKVTFIIWIIIFLLISFILFILFWIIGPINKCIHGKKQIKNNKATKN